MAQKSQERDRRMKAFLTRLEGATYDEIAASLGNITRERARQLVLQGAKVIAVSRHPCAQTALEFVRRRNPDFKGDPLDIINKRIRRLVAGKGGIEDLCTITPIEMLETKDCGRKTLRLITKLLRDRGLDWKFDEYSKTWWDENGYAQEFPLLQGAAEPTQPNGE